MTAQELIDTRTRFIHWLTGQGVWRVRFTCRTPYGLVTTGTCHMVLPTRLVSEAIHMAKGRLGSNYRITNIWRV